MGEVTTIDAHTQTALARLTDNEKECLRRRLRQQTAKEMALDLGVSPHAVEKRLKMARAKLGLSSSLEAARLLAASEGYQRTAPQAVDLASNAPDGEKGLSKPLVYGVLVMSLIAATLLVITLQGGVAPLNEGGVVSLDAGGVAPMPTAGAPAARAMPPGNVAPSEAEIVLMNQMTFHNADADNSGYIDGSESPISRSPDPQPQPVYHRDEDGNFVPTGERVMRTADEIQAQFYQMADRDGDGRISFSEFHRWSAPNLVRRGIPAAWREDMRHLISPEG